MLTPTHERLRHLPKAELHVHLDGSLRPSTLLELAGSRGVALPAWDERTLAERMLATDATSLEGYLERFRFTLAVMQDDEAIERIAYELAEDHALEGVRWLEVRFCPGLCASDGLTPAEALDAALAGLARARRDVPIETAVIVSAVRTLPPSVSVQMAELAVAYAPRGVCAFDLAGAEAGHPVRDHLEAVRVAERGGLPRTSPAGEGFGAASIREALELAHASRIGHGTRLAEDAGLLARVRAEGIGLEVCLTSNVQTRVAPSYAEHPLRRYFDEGVRVSLCTDNRLMSGVTVTAEYENARDFLGFGWDELLRVARTGFECAYAPESLRASLLEEFEARVREIS